jgi:hypothetical protein
MGRYKRTLTILLARASVFQRLSQENIWRKQLENTAVVTPCQPLWAVLKAWSSPFLVDQSATGNILLCQQF